VTPFAHSCILVQGKTRRGRFVSWKCLDTGLLLPKAETFNCMPPRLPLPCLYDWSLSILILPSDYSCCCCCLRPWDQWDSSLKACRCLSGDGGSSSFAPSSRGVVGLCSFEAESSSYFRPCCVRGIESEIERRERGLVAVAPKGSASLAAASPIKYCFGYW
jgi:hypothetical protein